MKKFLPKFFITLLLLIFLPPNFIHAADLSKKLAGRILLQIQSKGEAWYVNPATLNRYYMADGAEAYNIMRSLGIGISNTNLTKLQNNVTQAKKQSGKIFLQVESRGEAYYVNTDGKLYYLKDGKEAYNIMRQLGLGISNKDLKQIKASSTLPDLSGKGVNSSNISSASLNIDNKIQYVVKIVCPVKDGTMSGTGELIYGSSPTDNKVITNKHVLNGATGPCGVYRTLDYSSQPTLYFKSSNAFIFSTNYDLAIISPNITDLTTYTNANFEFNSDSDLLNKTILVLGYPASAGNNITLTKGIISGSEKMNNINMYKTDAKIDSGNSGGAVLDEDGKLIGIPTSASQGNFSSYGYIIPADTIESFLNIVDQEGFKKQNWSYPELSLYKVSPSNTVPDLPSQKSQDNTPSQNDSVLKVAQCQSDAKNQEDSYLQKGYQMGDEKFQPIINKSETDILATKQKIIDCQIAPGNPMMSPQSNQTIIDACVKSWQQILDYNESIYTGQLKLVQEYKDQIKQLAQQLYDQEYAKCLAK